MYRSKRLLILLAVLAVVCLAAFAALGWEQRQEAIQTSGQVVLEIPTDRVRSLSWTYGETALTFSRDEEGHWSYDADGAFPVDPEAMEDLLSPFAAFSAAFTIQDVEDYGQYGLEDPVCSISIATEEESWEILLGDTSAVDEQRYVSFGDGSVYLAVSDPLDQYDATLRDCVLNDDVPDFGQVTAITFSGAADYDVFWQEDGSAWSYCQEDVYFTERDGSVHPLDTERVEDYLRVLSTLGLDSYVTYDADQEDLAAYGLDDPELTVTVDYVPEDEEAAAGTFTLHLSRDPEERAQAEEADTADEEEAITAYARVEGSSLVYPITSLEYTQLMAASYDDLRHQEVLPADLDAILSIDVSLEGAEHTFTAQGQGEDRTWTYQGREIDFTGIQEAVEALTAVTFTQEGPEQQLEIALTVHLDDAVFPQVEVALYRYDGASCLAVVDGESLCLVERAHVVDLIEAVQSVVLGDSAQEEA